MKVKPPKYRGMVSFLGEEEKGKIDDVLSARMEKLGYDVYNPTMIGDVAVIKKIKNL